MKGFERMKEMKINHGLYPPTPRLRRAGRQAALTLAIVGMALTAAADPGITVSARQRYPWNGLVDINFTITGESGTKYDTSFAAKDMVGGTNIAMKTIRKSDGTTAAEKEKLLPGTYNWIWDAAADLPDWFQCERVTVAATADISAFPYTVKFNANGGTGSMANQSFTYGTEKALTVNAFTRTGYTFQGWATSASGAKVYNDKQSVSNLTQTSGAVVNLYAVWKGNSYSVKFNANGGMGTMSNESFTYGTAKALTANAFTRTGYTFQGWATSAGGDNVYNDRQVVSNLSTTAGAVVNLHAVWDHSKVQLWAGGPYWATTNIGAEKPEDCGYYFWWADIIGYKSVNNKWVASDGSSSDYSFPNAYTSGTDNRSDGKDTDRLYSLGWIDSKGANGVLTPARDAAHVHWGGNWRMPSRVELEALRSNCTWTWTTTNSVNGYVVNGMDEYASASIFIPCSGYVYEASRPYSSSSGNGYYWSSSPDWTNSTLAYWLSFYSGGKSVSSYGVRRDYGAPIRPVQGFIE